ncbi:hypothetical protein HD806DRAFT_537479 [Xylariaceae sp. AK1471]|nr:hypothetical protein HD806DRAFT_537479 [Xylariaceae sp. AK1471]
MDITLSTGSEPLEAQWMQVCPGGCNEEEKHDNEGFVDIAESPIRAEVITRILYQNAHARCDAAHPQRAEFLQIYSQIAWAEDSPIPAYFSPSKMQIVAHSSAVTSGHLALIQARGHIDNIKVDFWTADRQHEHSSRFKGWNNLAIVSYAITKFSRRVKRHIRR